MRRDVDLRMVASAVLICLGSGLSASAPARGQDLPRPEAWKVRFDAADARADQLYYVSMPPGWHITTGPSAILYDPANTAAGEYRVESAIFLFPGERLEGFGMFFGGRDLEGADQRYSYFLLRRDGRFLIKRRAGGETTVLRDWTLHEAVQPHGGDEHPVLNRLAIDVGATEVVFLVNETEVARLPRSSLDVDGLFGLRVNHNLNLHITALKKTADRG